MLRFTNNIISQMTLDCNLKCKYCYECHLDKWKGKYFTVDQFKNALDTVLYERCILGKLENNIQWHFHGGEVFMLPWEDLKKMISYIEERQKTFPGLSYCFQSNGTLITEEMAKYFAQKNIHIGISIDSLEDDDRMSKKGNLSLFNKLSYFHNTYNTSFSFLMTFSKLNMKNWVSTTRKLMELNGNIAINLLCPNSTNKYLVPSIEEQLEYWALPSLKSYLTKSPIRERNIELMVQSAVTDIVFNSTSAYTRKTGCFDRICGIYSNMIALDPDLNLHPCDKFLEEGKFISKRISKNINKRDFLGLQTAKRTINHYSQMFEIEKALGCDHCEARAICPGECQSYNISAIGKPKIDNGICKLYKTIYNFIESNILEILLAGPVQICESISEVKSSFQKKVNDSGLKIKYNYNNNTVYLEK